MSVSPSDPADVIRYWFDTLWDTTRFSPKPVIKHYPSKPNVRVTNIRTNYVRTYNVSETANLVGLENDNEDVVDLVSIDLRSFTRDRLKELHTYVKAILNSVRLTPNPPNSYLYDIIELDDWDDVSIEGKNIFHGVQDVKLLSLERTIAV